MRLDFCAGDRAEARGLGLDAGLLDTLDRSWGEAGARNYQEAAYTQKIPAAPQASRLKGLLNQPEIK